MVNSAYKLDQDELLLEVWYSWIYTVWRAVVTSRSSKLSVKLRPQIFLTIEKTSSMRSTTAEDIRKLCGHFLFPALGFPDSSEFLDATSFPVTFSWAISFPATSFSWLLHDSDSENYHNSWLSSVAAGFPATLSINPPRYASCSLT